VSSETFSKKPMKRETLADRVAADITELILSGSAPAGTALPTEPDLAEQYGVSRSVIRDAAKLLSARGLVEIRHGKGVFVTASQKEGFADAILLALRRNRATVWDAEEFIDGLFLLAVSLATASASDSEIDRIEELGNEFLKILDTSNVIDEESEVEEIALAAQDAHCRSRMAVFEATHNKVMQHLAAPLLSLRRLRMWDFSQAIEEIEDFKDVDVAGVDRRFQVAIVDCLRSRDTNRAFTTLLDFKKFPLPQEAIDIMKTTPIGESPHIVVDASSLEEMKEQLNG
jgi:GntR family transcriptional regulator, transcriptional repressor for pyruvate dehydrogenase complex